MPDGSPTHFWHQVRDQALHAAGGAGIEGLFLAAFVGLADPLWGLMFAAVVGAIREIIQWPTLHTPSWWDSIVDAAFWPLGALAVWAVYMGVT